MPEIKSYESQIGAAGPVNVQRATGEDFGSASGEGMQKFGQNVGQLGVILHQRDVQNDVADLHANMADAQNRLELQRQDQLQKGTLNHDDFMEDVGNEMDSIQQNVSTREGRLRYEEMAAETNLHFSGRAALGQAEIAGAKAVSDFKMGSNNRSSVVMNDPTAFDLQLKQQNDAIDDMVQSHGLSAVKSDELRRNGNDQLAIAKILGIAKFSPALAQKELDSGKYDKYFGEGTEYRLQMRIDKFQRAQDIADERQKKLIKEAADALQEKTMAGYVAQANTQGQDLDPKQIIEDLNSGKIDSAAAEHALRLAKQGAEDKKLKSDPTVFNDLAHRLTLPDGDPAKITDDAEINSHIGKDISAQDSSVLYNLLAERHTPQGEADAAVQKTFFESKRSQIVKGLPGMPDPEGMKIFQDVQSQSYQYALKAAQNGKTKMQIWSPIIDGKSNPDYVGNHVHTPQRSMEDIMKSTLDRLGVGMKKQPEGTTEMVLPDGTSQYIPNKNVGEATKRGAKVKGK